MANDLSGGVARNPPLYFTEAASCYGEKRMYGLARTLGVLTVGKASYGAWNQSKAWLQRSVRDCHNGNDYPLLIPRLG